MSIKPALLVLVALRCGLCQNLITTFAGAPKSFISSVAVNARATSVAPSRIAAGLNGEVYFGDREANVVLKLTPDGLLTVVAGNGIPGYSGDGGPATAASLNQPSGFAVDSNGNLFISDVANARVRKVDRNGIITTVAGNGTSGYSGDGGPAISASISGLFDAFSTNGHTRAIYDGGLAVDRSGNLYLADMHNGVVRKVDTSGIITTLAKIGSSDAVAVNSSGVVFVGSPSVSGSVPIQQISSNGTVTTFSPGTALTSGILSLTVDSNDHLYASLFTGRIVRYDSSGAATVVAGGGAAPVVTGVGVNFVGDGGPATSAGLAESFGVAVDPSGNIFVADTFNERIRKVDSAGVINTVAGSGAPGFFGDGGPSTAAGLGVPQGVAADSAGNVYIHDTNNGRIRKVDPKGSISTLADFTSGPYQLYAAVDSSLVAVFPDGSVGTVATSVGGTVIVKIDPTGKVTTIGGGGQTSPGDNGPATAAKLGRLYGLAADAAGNLYFLESPVGPFLLRKIDTKGILTTLNPNANGISLSVDPAGNILQAGAKTVQKISPSLVTTTIQVPQASALTGVAGDSQGNIFVADNGNHDQVLRIAADGTVTPYAGNNNYSFSGDGGPATQAALFGPIGLAVDSAGNLLIADSNNNRIREVLAAPVTYQVAPTSLTFSGTLGGAAPASQSIALASSVAGAAFAASASAPWLQVSPTAGAMPTSVQVSVDLSSLSPGSYQGTVTISVPNGSPASTTVAVGLNVLPGVSQPTLSVSTQSLGFSAVAGTGSQSTQLLVANSGGGALSFTALVTGGAWLSVAPASATATPSTPASLTITATPGSLAPGTYSGSIAITGGGTTARVPVTLSVTAPTAVILLSQTALTFTAVAQGGAPLPQSFGVLNTGQGSMSWTATAQTLSGGSNWLSLSPASGTVAQPYLDVSQVNVSIDPTSLPPGNYSGRIQVSAVALNTPQVLTVTLNVLPAGSNPGPELRPTGLIFTGAAGATPGSQDVMIGNPQAQSINFVSGSLGKPFTYLPSSGAVQPSQPALVRVFPDLSSVSPGEIDHGVITLLFADGTARTISVLTVVAPAASSASSELAPRASGGCPSQNLEIQFRSLQSNFVAVVGQATTVEVAVSDDCANLINTGGSSGAGVQATFSNGDAAVKLTSLGNGVWSGTWRPVHGTGAVTLTVTAFQIAGGGGQKAGQQVLSGVLSTGTATPIVTSGGVVQGASFAAGVPVAPGSLITIYGSNLANSSGSAGALPLPQQLNGAQVRMGNETLPLLYTSTGQMNVQVPFDVPLNTQYQVTVQKDNVLSVPEALVVAAAQPGIFTTNQQGTGQGVILKSDQITLAQAGTPAAIGETIVIYATGLGPVSPAVAAGAPAPLSPLSSTTNPVTVTIGGQTVAAAFAGLTPGFPGLYQVNVVVPAGVTSGDSVPVTIQVAGQASPPVTMSVH